MFTLCLNVKRLNVDGCSLLLTAPTQTTPSAASGQRCGWRSPPAGCAWPCTSGPWWPPWSSPTETSADLTWKQQPQPNCLHLTPKMRSKVKTISWILVELLKVLVQTLGVVQRCHNSKHTCVVILFYLLYSCWVFLWTDNPDNPVLSIQAHQNENQWIRCLCTCTWRVNQMQNLNMTCFNNQNNLLL